MLLSPWKHVINISAKEKNPWSTKTSLERCFLILKYGLSKDFELVLCHITIDLSYMLICETKLSFRVSSVSVSLIFLVCRTTSSSSIFLINSSKEPLKRLLSHKILTPWHLSQSNNSVLLRHVLLCSETIFAFSLISVTHFIMFDLWFLTCLRNLLRCSPSSGWVNHITIVDKPFTSNMFIAFLQKVYEFIKSDAKSLLSHLPSTGL